MTPEEVLIAVVPYWRHLSSVGDAAGVVIGCPAISVIRCCFVLTTPSAPVTRKSSVVYLPHSSAFPAHCGRPARSHRRSARAVDQRSAAELFEAGLSCGRLEPGADHRRLGDQHGAQRCGEGHRWVTMDPP